jgi:hypothetical protein
MKKVLLLSCWILLSGFISVKLSNCDYIETGYYQLIYEAKIAYLSGDKELAYQKIQEAEKTCPLLEQSIYYETSLYIELLGYHNRLKDAIFYITILVRDYGYSVNQIENSEYFKNIISSEEWPKLKMELDSLNKIFYTQIDTNLVKELTNMCNRDQEVRRGGQGSRTEQEFIQQLDYTDSINEVRIKEIFEQYGYPNERLIGHANTMITHRIGTLHM